MPPAPDELVDAPAAEESAAVAADIAAARLVADLVPHAVVPQGERLASAPNAGSVSGARRASADSPGERSLLDGLAPDDCSAAVPYLDDRYGRAVAPTAADECSAHSAWADSSAAWIPDDHCVRAAAHGSVLADLALDDCSVEPMAVDHYVRAE